jgi:hypothetical protein
MNTQRIKYAIEYTLTVPTHYTDEDIDTCIKTFANGRNYIWCQEHEELFYEENKNENTKN